MMSLHGSCLHMMYVLVDGVRMVFYSINSRKSSFDNVFWACLLKFFCYAFFFFFFCVMIFCQCLIGCVCWQCAFWRCLVMMSSHDTFCPLIMFSDDVFSWCILSSYYVLWCLLAVSSDVFLLCLLLMSFGDVFCSRLLVMLSAAGVFLIDCLLVVCDRVFWWCLLLLPSDLILMSNTHICVLGRCLLPGMTASDYLFPARVPSESYYVIVYLENPPKFPGTASLPVACFPRASCAPPIFPVTPRSDMTWPIYDAWYLVVATPLRTSETFDIPSMILIWCLVPVYEYDLWYPRVIFGTGTYFWYSVPLCDLRCPSLIYDSPLLIVCTSFGPVYDRFHRTQERCHKTGTTIRGSWAGWR